MRKRFYASIILTMAFSIAMSGCGGNNPTSADKNEDLLQNGDNSVEIIGDDERITGNEIVVDKKFVSFEDMHNFYSAMNIKSDKFFYLPFIDSTDYNVNYVFSGVCSESSYLKAGENGADYHYLYFGGEIYTLDEFGDKQQYCQFITLTDIDSFDYQTDTISYEPWTNNSNIYNLYLNENAEPFLRVTFNSNTFDNSKAADLLDYLANSIVQL